MDEDEKLHMEFNACLRNQILIVLTLPFDVGMASNTQRQSGPLSFFVGTEEKNHTILS